MKTRISTLLLIACAMLGLSGVVSGDDKAEGQAKVRSHLRAGDEQYKSSNWDKAIQEYHDAIALDPKSADAFYKRANTWQQKGDLDKAKSDYTKAISINPNRADVYYGRGHCFYKFEDFDKAIVDYTEAIRLSPKYEHAFLSRGAAWHGIGQFEKALDDYTMVLKINTKSSPAYANRGMTLSAMSKWTRAIEDFDSAIKIDDKNVRTYCSRGAAYFEIGDYDKALLDYDKALSIDKKDVRSLSNRALLRASCPDAQYRDGAKAVEDARLACELTNWKETKCLEFLAASYAEKGEFKDAIKWQQKVTEDKKYTEGRENQSSQTFLNYLLGRPYRHKSKSEKQ